MKFEGWLKVTAPNYTFTDSINIRKHSNGTSLDVMIGYVTEKPEKKQVVLSKRWPGGSRLFYIKDEEDWGKIVDAVDKMWPELDGKNTGADINDVIDRLSQEKRILEFFGDNPCLIDAIDSDTDIFALPSEQKEAALKLLKMGGDIATTTANKLSEETPQDLDDFNKILDAYRLATVNSLVTHIKARLNFIDTFETAIHSDATYERQGDGSVHSMLENNIWIVDSRYQVLQSDVSLRRVIEENWDRIYTGEESNRRPDLICMTELDESNKLVIIEIKRPSVTISMPMVEQVIRYKHILSQHSNRSYDDFTCHLVGREIDPLVKAIDLEKAGIVTKTYTDFIGSARKYYREYLQLVESNPKAI